MAIGTTADFNLSRNDLITLAYRKIGITATSTLITRAADALNLIIREEDAKGTRQAKNLWALSSGALQLADASHVYSSTEGLSSSILDLVSVVYRDTSGDDVPVDIIDGQQWEQIDDKNQAGDTLKVHLTENIDLSAKLLYVWPGVSSVGTTSEVTGSDSLNYQCIMGHTSAAANKPITGQNWRLYWVQQGSAGSAWVTATAYTNGEFLLYTYKRPLYDFDLSTDNPDMPSSWTRYLMWRLVHDICPEFDVDMESRRWIKTQYLDAANDLFGHSVANTTDIHNKGLYY